MKIIKASYKIMKPRDLNDPNVVRDIYQGIEESARTCYKSETQITDESAEKMIRRLIKNSHEAMLEHEFIKVKFIVDRGVSHELVRHRMASFAQESTRYCNYSQEKFGKEITVIEPVCFNVYDDELKDRILKMVENRHGQDMTDIPIVYRAYATWRESCECAEIGYFDLLDLGFTTELARSVLPSSLKTEVIMTANIREWRHILKLRAAGVTGKPHPQMLEVMVPLLNELRLKLPVLFDDIHAME